MDNRIMLLKTKSNPNQKLSFAQQQKGFFVIFGI
jgi:hypothetical protein